MTQVTNALIRILTAIGAFFAGLTKGKSIEQNKQLKNTIESAKVSKRIRQDIKLMSDADVKRLFDKLRKDLKR